MVISRKSAPQKWTDPTAALNAAQSATKPKVAPDNRAMFCKAYVGKETNHVPGSRACSVYEKAYHALLQK